MSDSPLARWELHVHPDCQRIAVLLKHLRIQDIEELNTALNEAPYLNRYFSNGDRMLANTADDIFAATPIQGAWKLTIDLSRNYLSFLDVDNALELIYDRLCSFSRDAKSIHKLLERTGMLKTVDVFLSSVDAVCLTSNTLKQFPEFKGKKYPNLSHLLINHNHLDSLEATPSLSLICPNLKELDLGHNRITSSKNLGTMINGLNSLER